MDAVTLEIVEAGSVQVGLGPFQPFAVVNGRQSAMVAVASIELAHRLQHLLGKRLPEDDIAALHAVWWECLALADLARMIFENAHGGTLLIVPSETGDWESSIAQFPYRLKEPDRTIPTVIKANLEETNERGKKMAELYKEENVERVRELAAVAFGGGSWSTELWRGPWRAIAPMTSVDGALIVTRDLLVLGFGAKIAASKQDIKIVRGDAGTGKQPLIQCSLEDLGGTRHQSAAQFVNANKSSVALVFSHDRYISLIYWKEDWKSVVVIRNVQWWL